MTRNFRRTKVPFNPRRRQPRAVLFKLGLPLSSRQLARTELVGKTLVEDQQSQSGPLSRSKAALPRLVLIPSPKISKVPTQTTRLQLEERELFCLEFPFEKSWDAKSLKTAILNRFPQVLLSEYVVNFHLCYSLKHCSTVKLKLKVAQNSFQHFPRGRF